MSTQKTITKITVPHIQKLKGREKITMLTAYDYPMAKLLDQCGLEIVLVGDSVGTVIYGNKNTLAVTPEQMIIHTRAVTHGVSRALVVIDMPFMSYQSSLEKAVEMAGRFIKETGAEAVKLEGGVEMKDTVKAIVRAGIPVMGHIGLTPQSINAMGIYRTFGKDEAEKDYLLNSAKALEEAGAFLIVLECIEEGLAEKISSSLKIPTIGIGSGVKCDGQVLVLHDLLGLTQGHVPKFVRPEAEIHTTISAAVGRYIDRTKKEG